jgi:hypothetical protein
VGLLVLSVVAVWWWGVWEIRVMVKSVGMSRGVQ